MCISTNLNKRSNKAHFGLFPEDPSVRLDFLGPEIRSRKTECSCNQVSNDDPILPERKETEKAENSEQQPPSNRRFEMKRALSLPGLGLLRSNNFVASGQNGIFEMSRQELESMVDPTKKEISRISKLQIKEYATKYNHLKNEGNKEKNPWYR